MKVVIIEDEILAAQHLEEVLVNLNPPVQVVKVLHTVKEALKFFKVHKNFDLVFCDIQLGDGHCFEIFKDTKPLAPVIFCTAYNQYAQEAFRNNGIDYILKPFTDADIEGSIEKYHLHEKRVPDSRNDYSDILEILSSKSSPPKITSLLINFKGKIIPVKIEEIALFDIDNKVTELINFSNQKYVTNHTLDELESICGNTFYRANRQYLINRKAIEEVVQFYARKLLIKLKIEGNREIVIPKGKVPDFLDWLSR